MQSPISNPSTFPSFEDTRYGKQPDQKDTKGRVITKAAVEQKKEKPKEKVPIIVVKPPPEVDQQRLSEASTVSMDFQADSKLASAASSPDTPHPPDLIESGGTGGSHSDSNGTHSAPNQIEEAPVESTQSAELQASSPLSSFSSSCSEDEDDSLPNDSLPSAARALSEDLAAAQPDVAEEGSNVNAFNPLSPVIVPAVKPEPEPSYHVSDFYHHYPDDFHGRFRYHSREASEALDFDDDALNPSEVMHIPREATTISRSHSYTQLRRRKRSDSEASVETLERRESSYNLLKPSSRPLRTSFSAPPIMRLDSKIIAKILKSLPIKQMFRMRLVCKQWFNAVMDSELSSHIDLSGINKEVNDEVLFSIGKICGPKLKYICIRNCWNITDPGFQNFISYTPNLEVVDMNSCWELTDLSVSDLGTCKTIRRLDLSNCRKVSDVTLASTLKGSESLTELKVSYCKNLTNTTMTNIGRYASGINILYLQRCTSISDAGFSFLRNPETPLSKLTVLSLSDCSFLTDEAILSISKGCPALRSLNLNFCCALTPSSIDYLVEGCPKLLSLDVSFCGAMVSDEGLEVISKGLLELERFSFRSCIMVTKEGLDHLIRNCKNLKYINPSSCKGLTKEILAQVPSHWKVLSGNVSLVELGPTPYFPKTSADGKFSFPK